MTEIGDWWQQMLANADEESQAIHDAYQQLENHGYVNRVVVHRYICRAAGCKLATVVKIGETVVARTTDYKLAPGTNAVRSVESARLKNTLDCDRHWPGHTFDVSELAGWGDQAGIDMNCRHGLRTMLAVEIIAKVSSVRPGHPGAPSRI